MGVIVNHGLPAGSHLGSGSVHRLPPNLRESLANALQPAFLAASLLCLVTLVIVALWLKQVPLREGGRHADAGAGRAERFARRERVKISQR